MSKPIRKRLAVAKDSVNDTDDISSMLQTLQALRLSQGTPLVQKDPYTFDFLAQRLNRYIRNEQEIDEDNKLLGPSKQLRHANFDSDISENIVKFAIYNYFGIMPTWQTTVGDLQYVTEDKRTLQFEVKGFMSQGPSSFGPKEAWHCIFFVNCMRYKEKYFTVYCIPLENTSTEWRSINMKVDPVDFDEENIPEVPESLETLSCTALKELCMKRGIKHTGSKTELIKYLRTLSVGSAIKKVRTYGEIADENKRGELRGIFDTGIRPRLLPEQCFPIFDGQLEMLRPADSKL